MVVYAAIPTTGLPSPDAAEYASFLQFAATTGQTPGDGIGQLPPGYLPMTSANDLGAFANYTTEAATDVGAQKGQVPLLIPAAAAPPTTTTVPQAAPDASLPEGSGNEPGLTLDSPLSARLGLFAPPTGTATVTATKTKLPLGLEAVSSISLGKTPSSGVWVDGLFVILVVGVALLGAFSAPLALLFGRWRKRW
jgi:hypothetical protein